MAALAVSHLVMAVDMMVKRMTAILEMESLEAAVAVDRVKMVVVAVLVVTVKAVVRFRVQR